MGAGTYWAVVYGCRDFTAHGNGEKVAQDDSRAVQLDEIFNEFGIQTSCEGSSRYAGVVLRTTLRHENEIPSGVMSVDELPSAIRIAVAPELDRAKATWEKARNAAAEIGLMLPEGELLWLADYD